MPARAAVTGSVLVLCFALAGCSSIRGFPEPPATSTATRPTVGFQLGPSIVEEYNAERDPAKKQLIRNEIIDARMAEIDRKFADYERALYQEGVGSGIGTDWALLALTAAATVSTVETTKTALAAAATAVAGGVAAFDKRALFDKTLPALLAQMVAQRETVRVLIRTKELLPVDSYSWFAAESDLQRFEFAGSIPGAIVGVAEDAGEKTATARQEQKELTKVSFKKTSTSTRLLEFWKPGGKVNADNAKRLSDWMKANGLATGAGTVTMFIFDADSEDLRAKAINDLGIP